MKPLNTYHVCCEGQIHVVQAHMFTFDTGPLELIIENEDEEYDLVAYFPTFSWIIKQPEGTPAP